MLVSNNVFKALEIIEDLTGSDFISIEFFSDGSGHILNDRAERLVEWDKIEDLEDSITEFIGKRS